MVLGSHRDRQSLPRASGDPGAHSGAPALLLTTESYLRPGFKEGSELRSVPVWYRRV